MKPFFIDYISNFFGREPKKEQMASEKAMYDKLVNDMKELAASKAAPSFFTKPIPPPVKFDSIPIGAARYNVQGSYTVTNRAKYPLSASWAPISGPLDPAKYPKSASYAINPNIKIDFSKTGGLSGKFDDLDIDWSNISLSGFVVAPTNEAALTVRVFLGSPVVCQSSVAFSTGSLAKQVWLNNNMEVVNAALARFNEKARAVFGAGNIRFSVVNGDSTHKDETEIIFEYLMYEELAIKSVLKHRVKHEGMDPMKILADVAATCEFYVVGEMVVDEEEGIIEQFEIQELKYLNRFHNIDSTLIKI